MKNKILFLLIILILLPIAAHAGTMNVQVRKAIVRTTPNYLGGQAGLLKYGDSVHVVGDQGNWYRITSPAGWLPKSAVTKKKVALNPEQRGKAHGARHDEVALAGKGFNPQVEAQYKRSNAQLAAAYVRVDRVERKTANQAQLRAFQKSGKLTSRP
jgi:Bacterial SH3 domain